MFVDLRYRSYLIQGQLEQALGVSEQDVKDASSGVLKDLKRFQQEKEDDLKRYMVRKHCFLSDNDMLIRSADCVCALSCGLGEEES